MVLSEMVLSTESISGSRLPSSGCKVDKRIETVAACIKSVNIFWQCKEAKRFRKFNPSKFGIKCPLKIFTKI